MAYPKQALASEHVVNGVLRWSVSWSELGRATEEDGCGPAPLHVRAMLLAQNGRWRVVVTDLVPRVSAMTVLRSTFDISLDEAARSVAALPGQVYSGTRGEAALLVERFTDAKVTAILERDDNKAANRDA